MDRKMTAHFCQFCYFFLNVGSLNVILIEIEFHLETTD